MHNYVLGVLGGMLGLYVLRAIGSAIHLSKENYPRNVEIEAVEDVGRLLCRIGMIVILLYLCINKASW